MSRLSLWRLSLVLGLATTVSATAVELIAAAPLVDDRFAAESSQRRPMRGPWKIEAGVATCTQDDELYKKHKDHGPVIWYDAPFQNAAISFELRPDDHVKTFVFTVNGAEGHVFRFISSPAGTTIVAFPPSADHKSKRLAGGGPKLKPGEWTKVTVELRGPNAKVKIGDDYTAEVGDPSVDRPKTIVGLGFSFGTMQFKNFRIDPL